MTEGVSESFGLQHLNGFGPLFFSPAKATLKKIKQYRLQGLELLHTPIVPCRAWLLLSMWFQFPLNFLLDGAAYFLHDRSGLNNLISPESIFMAIFTLWTCFLRFISVETVGHQKWSLHGQLYFFFFYSDLREFKPGMQTLRKVTETSEAFYLEPWTNDNQGEFLIFHLKRSLN